MKKREKQKGITLIALVITIIVLIILAGVTINALIGDNGILQKAQEAKERTQIGNEKEIIQLAMAELQIREKELDAIERLTFLQQYLNEHLGEGTAIVDYDIEDGFIINMIKENRQYSVNFKGVELSVDWEKAMKEAVAPNEQIEERNQGAIGIGTDGKPVNMDLWEYTLLEEGTYALNDEEVIHNANIENKGYLGGFNSQGEIEGKVPAYIKTKSDNHFKPVTDMNNTFRECTDMINAPEIPKTVTSMYTTFNSCTHLKKASILPNSLLNMYGLFYSCYELKEPPIIPQTVTNMSQAFVHCKKMEYLPKIPQSVTSLRGSFAYCVLVMQAPSIPTKVTDMKRTFIGCTNLKQLSTAIPETVDNLQETFAECPNLTGTIQIEANPTSYEDCFRNTATNAGTLILTGNSHLLNEICATKSSNSIIQVSK